MMCVACREEEASWAVLISIIDGNNFEVLCTSCTKMSAWSVAADDAGAANKRVGGFEAKPLMEQEDFELFVIMSLKRYAQLKMRGAMFSQHQQEPGRES